MTMHTSAACIGYSEKNVKNKELTHAPFIKPTVKAFRGVCFYYPIPAQSKISAESTPNWHRLCPKL